MDEFTDFISIYPILAMAAIRSHGAAWRVWAIAHYLDEDGSGRAKVKDVTEFLQKYLSYQSTRYQINQALKAEFIRNDKVGEYYYYISPKKLAERVGAIRFDRQKINLSIEQLFDKNWRKFIWASTLEEIANPKKPISRQALTETTGVNKLRQLRNECGTKIVSKTSNAIDTGFDSSYYHTFSKLSDRYFVAGGKTYKRIGNSYTVLDWDIVRGSRGRCRKIRTDNLYKKERIPFVRYYRNTRMADQAVHHNPDGNYIYTYIGKLPNDIISNCRIWKSVK